MKILFITYHYLDNNSGGSFASRAFINAFTELADACMLLYPYRGTEISSYIHKKCILKKIEYNKTKLDKIIDIFSGNLNRFNNIAFNYINDFSPDLIVFDKSLSSLNLIKRIRLSQIKIITIHHNYEMEYYSGTKPSFLLRLPLHYYIRKAEKESIAYSDLNLTLTNQDIYLLKKNYDLNNQANFYCLGVFESKNENVPSIHPVRKDDKIVCIITGNLSSKQTHVSIVDFVNNYFDYIEIKYPEVELIIAGHSPSSEIKKLCLKHSKIKLIDSPEDINKVIKGANIYICPVNQGGGLKLRILDGLRLGLPVLTHLISARGYDNLLKFCWFNEYNSKADFCLKFDEMVDSLKQNKFSNFEIQNEFYNNFSFEKGIIRLKELLNKYIIQ